jgi:O-glycosyl hydrolase
MRNLLILISILAFSKIIPVRAQDTDITIYRDNTYQTIAGFGGFGAKKVWWDSPPYYDQEYLNQVIDSLGCTFIRTQIYWDAEPVNDNNDPHLINWSKFRFDAGTENGKQFEFIRDLGAKGARLLATVWTPPIWMKGLEEFHGTFLGNPVRRRPSNDDLNQYCSWCGGAGGCLQVGGRLKPEYNAEFAEYLVAYVRKVKEETGVDVWGINIQNEPYFPNPFESCVVIPEEYADILKTVGERFAAEGITTRLFGPEHMGEVSWGVNNEYIREILEDEAVKPFLSFYAVHSYVDGVAPDYGSAEGWTALYDKIVRTHGRDLWMTETSDFEKEGYDLGFSMAKSLYLGLKFGRISGWIYWAMADYVIKNNKLTSLGRAFQQYYRFLTPGTVMVRAETADPDLLVVAGIKADNLVVIIINNSDQDKSVHLEGTGIPSEYYTYRTSSTENFIKLQGSGQEGIFIKAGSITTLSGTDLPSGLHNTFRHEKINIFPNPATETIHINNATGCRLYIRDFQGRCLLTDTVAGDRYQLNISNLLTGIYLVTVSGANRQYAQKLTVMNP